MAAEIHQSAHGEGDDARRFELAIGAGAAKATDRSQHQRGIQLLQIGVADPQLIEIAIRLVFDHHVGVGGELTKFLAAIAIFEIQYQTMFVAMIRSEGQAAFTMGCVIFERPFAPHRITARRLDKQHFGAKISQQ
jgi:hypothetical protein